MPQTGETDNGILPLGTDNMLPSVRFHIGRTFQEPHPVIHER
jgi:hypothetical protein